MRTSKPKRFLRCFRRLDLSDEHIDGVNVRRCADLRDQQHIEPWTGFHNIDHIANTYSGCLDH